MDKLYQISAKHFCAGLTVEAREEGPYCVVYRVVTTAPILNYMRGWALPEMVRYCRKKEWKLELIRDNGVTNHVSRETR